MQTDTLGLYFRLREGEKADLEIISSAAIAWVETLRATAKALDPDAEIRVELIDADESSLLFNTLVAWFEKNVERRLERLERGGQRLPRTRKLALALAIFLVSTGYPTYLDYFGDPDFTEEDRERMKRIEEKLDADISVQTAKRKFFRTLEREPSVVAVGIKERKDAEPIFMVPSERFPEAGGLWAIEEGVQGQITHPVLEVVLVKPALVHTPRTWTFKPDGLPEFDAVMRDGKVLQAIQDKGFPAQMREGVRMTIRLEVREVLVDGQWKLVRGGRSVMRVITPKLD